jgi:hypothetical protein
MADAARATSAAPTFFDPVRIMRKILVDGGYGDTNNPSVDAWRHYTLVNEILRTDSVRWVNIGTGTSTDHPILPKRQWKDLLLPQYVQNIMHTIRDLEKIATDSEKTGVSMNLISNMDRSKLDFSRFSATNGVHAIALDDYRIIDNKELENLTKDYLSDSLVEVRLNLLAQSIAEDVAEKLRANNAPVMMEPESNDPLPSDPHQPLNSHRPAPTTTTESQYHHRFSITGTDVPSMAGASENTAETSSQSVSQTPPPPQGGNNDSNNSDHLATTVSNPDLDSIMPLTSDNVGVGDQFKFHSSHSPQLSPSPTTIVGSTDLGPPTRSSTAP